MENGICVNPHTTAMVSVRFQILVGKGLVSNKSLQMLSFEPDQEMMGMSAFL